MLMAAGIMGVVATGLSLPADAAGTTKVSGTRFEMTIPDCWAPGYKDLDNLFMIFFKDPNSGAVLEGVYLRGASREFKLKTSRRVDSRTNLRGQGPQGSMEGDATIAGRRATSCHLAGCAAFEKHTAQSERR
jgi:hypothetical protein